MKEINITEQEINEMKQFNKGGYEGQILLYKPEILLKRFEPCIMPFLDMPNKKYKLIEFNKMQELNNIIALPNELVNIDNQFQGFTMNKIDAITIDNLKDYNRIIETYIKLFKNLEILHSKDIIVGDLKDKNIIVDDNNNPTFVDVDSMGINNIPQDHIERGIAGTVRRIPGINNKYSKNDYKSIDKLLLLATFVEKLTKENIPFTQKILKSNLSNEAKELITNFVEDDIIDYNLKLDEVLENERKR